MSSIANIFRKKKPVDKNAPFDRAARDALRRRPAFITQSEDRLMLVGDSRGRHILINPIDMRGYGDRYSAHWRVKAPQIFIKNGLLYRNES